jgi:hypothetical protein
MNETKSAQELRKFGLTVGGAFLVFGAIRSYFHFGTLAMALFGVGSVLGAFGLVFPTALRPVEKAWMRLAHVLAYVNTRIILTVLFYLVFTPIGLISRLVRDPLNRKLHDGSTTYWIRREPKPADRAIYERQF